MTLTPIKLVYVTYPNTEVAQTAAKELLQEKLIACANIMTPHKALYTWQGQCTEEEEVAVIYKTTTVMIARLRQYIAEKHPYDIPCILTGSVDANSPFANWVQLQITDQEV